MCQLSEHGLESRVKSLESDNSSLEQRCRVLQKDSASNSDELQQLISIRNDLQSQLTQLTDRCTELAGNNAQVCHMLLSQSYICNVHTHTGYAGTRKVKPIWILLKQETVSGSGISWAICKSAPRSRQITMPAPRHSVFYRPNALPAAQPTASKH